MKVLNVEIKARCSRPGMIQDRLEDLGASHKGTDHQTDTYFRTERGRLKLREGTIENHLIYYERDDTAAPKRSDIRLVPTAETAGLKELLTEALEVTITVTKKREIYFIDNVKFHIDRVEHLGSFMEIEAIDRDGALGEQHLQEQCEYYMDRFGIKPSDLVEHSYSDLLMRKNKP